MPITSVDALIESMWRYADEAVADPNHELDRAQLGVNFPYWCVMLGQVEDKITHNRVDFRFKPIQRQLTTRILRRWLAGEPVRIIILKARREGVSTLIKLFQFWVCWSMTHRKALTIAHDDETTRFLHGILENLLDWLPVWGVPMTASSIAGKVIEFANPTKNKTEKRRNPGLQSAMRTITLKNQGAGQGYTVVHLSEVGLEPWSAQAGQKAMNTVLQTVPRAAYTLVVKESTARGIGTPFHGDWVRAESGVDENEYEAIFFGWHEEPTNRAKAPHGFVPNDEEQEIKDEYGLSDDQVWWRRLTIANECGGNLDVFHQEHPMTPEEAFLSSGRPYFHRQSVKRYYDACDEFPAPHVGRLEQRDEQLGDRNDGHGYVVFVPSPRQATLRVWRPPHDLEDYLIFADAAGGGADAIEDWDTDLESPIVSSSRRADGDWQAAYVIRRSEPEIVAAYHSRVSRTEYGDDLFMLGKLYAGVTRRDGRSKAGAKIAVEVTGGWGEVPLQRLRWLRYPRLYKQVLYDHAGKPRQQVLGWHTTIKTRAVALDALGRMMREGELRCWDPHLFRECQTFVYNDKGKPEAQAGCHDDRVIAAAGACHLWLHEGRRRLRRPLEAAAPRSTVTGY